MYSQNRYPKNAIGTDTKENVQTILTSLFLASKNTVNKATAEDNTPVRDMVTNKPETAITTSITFIILAHKACPIEAPRNRNGKTVTT